MRQIIDLDTGKLLDSNAAEQEASSAQMKGANSAGIIDLNTGQIIQKATPKHPSNEEAELEIKQAQAKSTHKRGGRSAQAGGDSDDSQKLEEFIMSLPAAKPLAEFAAATNRSLLGALDFFTVDNINAVLDIIGSESRATTLTDSLGDDGGYMGEGLGRDVVRAAGEAFPSAVLAGQAFRSAANTLPKMIPSESAGRGVVRQLGQSTAKQDASAAILAATGAEVGDEVGGDTGRAIGSIVAPTAAGAVPSIVKKVVSGPSARRAVEEATPTIDELKDSARTIYKQLDDAGVVYSGEKFSSFVNQTLKTIKRKGFNSKIHPKVSASLDELANNIDKDLTLTELDTLRRVAKAAARSIDPDEARLGGMVTDKIDDFMANTKTNASEGGTEKVRGLFAEARNLWGRARRTELIEEAIEKAQNQASGFENGLRVQFRSLLNNKKKIRGFSAEEKAAIAKVVRGGRLENAAKALGKFGFSEQQSQTVLLAALGAGAGAAVAGPAGAMAVPLVGQASKAIAQKLTRDNATLAKRLVSAGSNAERIAKAYLSSTPPKARRAEDLAAILLSQKIPVDGLKKSDNVVIANAGYIASVLSAIEPPDSSDDDKLSSENGD